MIALLPYQQLSIEAPLPVLEAALKLKSVLQSKRSFWNGFFGGGTGFEGDVTAEGFRIVRRIKYQNSFLPIVYGKFEAIPGGTRVRVRFGLHPFTLGFFALLIAAGSGEVIAAIHGWLHGTPLMPNCFEPFIFSVFVYLMATGGFAFETAKAMNFLKEVYSPKPAKRAINSPGKTQPPRFASGQHRQGP